MALIELVVAIVIIAFLAVALYGLWGRGHKGKDKSLPAQAVDRAHDVECKNMLSQVRASIQMAMQESEQPPPAIPADMAPYAKCPQTQQPYTYDPQTGQVHCTTPGHEAF
jgi:hypothetical protein